MQRVGNFFHESGLVLAALARSAYRSLRGNKGLAAISIVFAFGLWIFVTDAENPTRTRVLPVDIRVEAVNVEPNVVVSRLTRVGQDTDATVRVRISVQEDTFDSLGPGDFQATVDLQGLTVGEFERPVDVEASTTRGGLRVEEVLPEEVFVVLVAKAAKEVPVLINVTGELAAGYTMGAPEPEEPEISVSGPAEKIALVTQAVGSIDVEGRTGSVDQAIRLEPRDDNGNLVEKLTLEPQLVNVVIEIEQTTFSRPVTVSPVISGVPADGYNIVSVSSNPVTMTIKGTQASVREITTLSTQPVDVQGEESDVVKSVSLQLPPDVSVIGSPNVTVTIRIEPAQGTVRFAVPATVRGLGDSLAVRDALPTVQVTLTGLLPDLLELSPQDISVSLDLSGKNAGTHKVKVDIILPAGLVVTAKTAEPTEIELTLEKS